MLFIMFREHAKTRLQVQWGFDSLPEIPPYPSVIIVFQKWKIRQSFKSSVKKNRSIVPVSESVLGQLGKLPID